MLLAFHGRVEYLEPNGIYADKMYAQLAAEVRAFVEEEFEERAAIMEYDGAVSRDEAERLAFSAR